MSLSALVDFLGTADASFAKHPFQLGQIRGRERAVSCAACEWRRDPCGQQERARLGAKSLEIVAGLEARQFNVDLRAQLVLGNRIDQLATLLVVNWTRSRQ